jgi:hypothetical protein
MINASSTYPLQRAVIYKTLPGYILECMKEKNEIVGHELVCRLQILDIFIVRGSYVIYSDNFPEPPKLIYFELALVLR